MKKRLFAAGAALMLACTASGCYFFPAEEELLAPPVIAPDEVTYTTYTAKIKDIRNSTNATGYLRSRVESECYFTGYTGKVRNIYVRAGDSVEEGDLIADMNIGALDYELEIQRLKVEAARLRFNSTGSQEDKLQLQIEENTLEMYQAEYDGGHIFAPMSGLVYYVYGLNPGTEVDPYKVLARIADPNELFVSAPYTDFNTFAVGDKVKISITGETFDGVVVYTPKEAYADGAEEKDILYIDFEGETPPCAYLGGIAEITRVNAEASGVVVIPKNLVKTEGERKYVQIYDNGEKREADVVTGISNATEIEIVSGVKAGELVIIK